MCFFEAWNSRLTGVVFLVAVVLSAAACAPVTYNRYQIAQPLGTGKMKMEVAASYNRDLTFPIAWDIESKMDAKLMDWAAEHPQYLDEASQIAASDFFMNIFLGLVATSVNVFAVEPEIIYAVGVHETTDLEIRVSGTGYARINTKTKAADLGRYGAFAVAPGIGYRNISQVSDEEEGAEDRYRGYVLTFELPLLFSWKFDNVAPYFGPCYYYHYMPLEYTRKIDSFYPVFNETIREDYHFHNVGLTIGTQFKFGGFIFAPEMVMLYNNANGFETGSFHPGLALGGTW
jgi:hypothetical protein